MNTKELGYVVSVVTFFVLTIMVMVGLAMSSLTVLRQKVATNSIFSTQSYYAAESGIEDALQRLDNNPALPATSYTLAVGPATATVDIPAAVGSWRTITSQGAKNSMKRNIQVVYGANSQQVNFYYGVMAGAGGLSMGGGSVVNGNVFSGGNVSGSGTITAEAVVSGNSSLQGVTVNGTAYVRSCLSPAVVGNLTYVSGGTKTCTVQGSTAVQSSAIATQPMPISQAQLTAWQNGAIAGGTINQSVTLSNGTTTTLGPTRIQGNLTVSNGATLILNGTVYVTGTISISNNATVRLSAFYGSLGGILMSSGAITIGNGSNFLGSGQTGSYVMLVSLSSASTAINVNNNALGAVLYAPNGGVVVANGVSVLEATGYSVTMSNNSQVQYSTGISNIYFSSGPGAAGKVITWTED